MSIFLASHLKKTVLFRKSSKREQRLTTALIMDNNLNVLYFIVVGSLFLNTASAIILPTTDTSVTDTLVTDTLVTDTIVTEIVLTTTSPTDEATTEEPEPTTSELDTATPPIPPRIFPTTPTETVLPTTSPTPTEISTQTTTDAATTEEQEPTTNVLGPIIYEDCVQAQEKTCYQDGLNMVFSIKARTEVGYAPLECMDDNIVPYCPGSGWTRVGVLNGTAGEPDTSYYSDAWTSKNTHYGFNPGFWSAYVGEVCFHTDEYGFVLPVHAPSLRSLFFGKKILDVDKDQFPGDFVDDCYEVGFNVGDPDFIVIRAGIVAVRNKTGCNSVLPAAVGVGIYNISSPVLSNAHGHLTAGSQIDPKVFIVAVRSLPGEEPTGTSATGTTPAGATDPTTSAESTTDGATDPTTSAESTTDGATDPTTSAESTTDGATDPTTSAQSTTDGATEPTTTDTLPPR